VEMGRKRLELVEGDRLPEEASLKTGGGKKMGSRREQFDKKKMAVSVKRFLKRLGSFGQAGNQLAEIVEHPVTRGD